MRRLLFISALFVFLVFIPAAAYAVPHYSQAYSKRVIRSEAKAAGYGWVQREALLHLSRHESTWHNWSHARSECHGLFQLSKGMAHGHRWWDPSWNTRRAIRYISGRYGSPVRALAHFHSRNWY